MADMSAAEQLMLELVNRARLDPEAEADRLGIDLNQGLDPGTISTAAKPVLAGNGLLVDAARDHSQWMLDTDTFSHTGEGGSSISERIAAAGYRGARTTGENISWTGTSADSIDLEAAIADQHDGLFRSSGHRENLMNAGFLEVGIGQRQGIFTRDETDWTASMVTQNFASSGDDLFVTGVVYNDTVVDDDFYSAGEGVGGVTVSAGSRSVTTTDAGGYALALPAGTHTVMIDDEEIDLTLSDANIKLDLVDGRTLLRNLEPAGGSGSDDEPAGGSDQDGTGGADSLVGGSDDDTLEGGGGDDVLVGNAGADRLDGGSGTDWVLYTDSDAGVTVTLWDGEAESGGHAAGDTLVSIEDVRGSAFDDLLSGNDGANTVEGLDGDDVLAGRGGDDILRGAHGDDRVDGGDGDDAAVGGPGHDRVFGGAGDDALRGNSQNDRVHGEDGNDRVYGNIGGDQVWGDAGDDFLWGLTGNDRLFGGAGADTLYGGFGGDILQGGAGADELVGGGGTDIYQLTVGGGSDTIREFEIGGTFEDMIDVHRLLADIGYGGSTPVADGVVRVRQDGDAADVQVRDASGAFGTVVTALDTDAAALQDDRYFVTDDTFWFGT